MRFTKHVTQVEINSPFILHLHILQITNRRFSLLLELLVWSSLQFIYLFFRWTRKILLTDENITAQIHHLHNLHKGKYNTIPYAKIEKDIFQLLHQHFVTQRIFNVSIANNVMPHISCPQRFFIDWSTLDRSANYWLKASLLQNCHSRMQSQLLLVSST